jgi:hypothetical protein
MVVAAHEVRRCTGIQIGPRYPSATADDRNLGAQRRNQPWITVRCGWHMQRAARSPCLLGDVVAAEERFVAKPSRVCASAACAQLLFLTACGPEISSRRTGVVDGSTTQNNSSHVPAPAESSTPTTPPTTRSDTSPQQRRLSKWRRQEHQPGGLEVSGRQKCTQIPFPGAIISSYSATSCGKVCGCSATGRFATTSTWSAISHTFPVDGGS